MTTVDIAWLAGLLEGEGCFRTNGASSPSIHLNMTDEDVVRRAGCLMGSGRIGTTAPKGRARKTLYTATIHGTHAAQWMMTLYPLLGFRRRAAVRSCLTRWRSGYSWGVMCRRGLHRIEGDNLMLSEGRRRCRACYDTRRAA